MANYQNDCKTALQIYKNGYKDKFYSNETPQSKVFFKKLREAVIRELETTGFCDLVDSIIDARRGKIDIVVYSVFADIVSGYERQMMIDVENDSKYYDYIPHIKVGKGPLGLIGWSECGRMNEHSIALSEGTLDTIRKARQIVRIKHIKLLKNDMHDGNSEMSDIVSNAQKEAEQIIEGAKREADRIIHESKLEAERINESAQTCANTIFSEANSKAKETAGRLIEKYLLEEQKHYKNELNEELRRHTSEHLERTKRAATTHFEMCDATNALQVKWIQALDDALGQMSAIKAEFYSHIHDWQVSLFPSEIKPLAERYLELYRIINVDKLLREAILFKEATEVGSDLAENIGETENITTVSEECPDAVIAGLQRLNKTLTTFLRRFETALNGFDLYVFYPNAGDEFDDMWHILEDEDDEYYGKWIKECVIPGIAKKANDDCGDDVLIPAVVKVEMER